MTLLDNQVFSSFRADFRQRLLSWAISNTRTFPWRSPKRSAYDLLIAEILLKRTTAASAARVYESFLRRYPDLQHLTEAGESRLLKAFSPVGLQQQRADAVIKMTSYLSKVCSGELPCSLEALLQVPGLGHYSARAVLSFGYGIPAAIVDGNVARVLRRVFGTTLPERGSQHVLQAFADDLLPNESHRQYNFALIDHGALVCRPLRPRCDVCPLTGTCDYYRRGGPNRVSSYSLVRETRNQRRMSLSALAVASGVAKITIINIEAGRTSPRPDTLRKLADALDTNLDALI